MSLLFPSLLSCKNILYKNIVLLVLYSLNNYVRLLTIFSLGGRGTNIILFFSYQFWLFFGSILAPFGGFGKIKKSGIADPRWLPLENMTSFSHHVATSADVVDLKHRNFHVLSAVRGRLSFVVIASILWELRRPPLPPRPVLNWVNKIEKPP